MALLKLSLPIQERRKYIITRFLIFKLLQRLGDWRPHLAMILSNPYPGSDINRYKSHYEKYELFNKNRQRHNSNNGP